jgi:predicted DCC family thiol-disulfide oxidoreductase YuxK
VYQDLRKPRGRVESGNLRSIVSSSISAAQLSRPAAKDGVCPPEGSPGRRHKVMVWIGALVIIATALISLLFYLLAADEVIRSMYAGTSFSFLNRLLKHRGNSLDYDIVRGKVVFSHLATKLIALELLALAIVLRERVWKLIENFFTAADHPLNLAIFRIVIFWQLIAWTDLSEIRWYSRIPSELRVAPWGMGAVLTYLPINERLAAIATMVLFIFAAAGLIGLFARASAFVCAVLGWYCLGIPQFYGKVDHCHHLVWFCAILAASPCSDLFSIDAVFKSWKRAANGITDPPGPSRAYALPLRVVWLLVGMIYFFPGFWKLWQHGWAWALSDNLQNKMHLKWTELHWVPAIRMDRHPILFRLGAGGTILFELSVIALIFLPRLRLTIPLFGVAFHNLNGYLMQIGFRTLQWTYVSLFNWNSIFSAIGTRIFRNQMFLLYDGSCKMCRRTIASLRVFDILGRVTYIDNFDRVLIDRLGLPQLTAEALARDMYAVVQKRSWPGLLAYRQLANRIPLLWPLAPFLYIWPVPAIGARIYRRVADSRACSIKPKVPPKTKEHNYRPLIAVATVGSILLIANVWCGTQQQVSGWPFSCYPTFSHMTSTETTTLSIEAISQSGELIPMGGLQMTSERLLGLNRNVIYTKDETLRETRLRAVWRLWVQNNPELRRAVAVRFYEDTIQTAPELWPNNPVHRSLLLEYRPVSTEIQAALR